MSGEREKDTQGAPATLLPCPLCEAGETEINDDCGIVEVDHICARASDIVSQGITVIGKNRAAAIAAWNKRAAIAAGDGCEPRGEPVLNISHAILLEQIHAIKETEKKMPRVYQQGWQDACDACTKAISDSFAGGGNRIVREMASTQIVPNTSHEEREKALEEAATIAENFGYFTPHRFAGKHIAARIRSLRSKEQP